MAGIHQPIKIQWNLTNHCNFNCEYCPDVLKSGSILLPDPQTFVRGFSLVYNKFSSLRISLLGGEPTTYRGLEWALDSVDKDPNKKITLETNASREISWWNKYAEFLDKVIISFHLHFLKLEHLIFVLETLKDKNISVHIKLPITPKYWDDILKVRSILKDRGYDSELQLLYKNFTKGNNDYYVYGEQQLDYYYKDKDVSDIQIPEQIEYKKIYKLNQFHGHMCWAGVEQLVIDKFGNVYRGWCEQGGLIGNVYANDVKWPEGPIMCQKYLCSNGFDLEARKSENSWGRL